MFEFPEIRERFKRFLPDTGEPISLDLKESGVYFDGEWYARNGFPRLAAMYGGTASWAGEPVSRETALNHSVVWACNRVVSETVGFLPANMMQEKGGEKQEALTHPMYSALKYQPNDEITSQTFRETLTSHCLLQGNGYAQIIRRAGTEVAHELQLLTPEMVTPDREKTGQKRLVYVVKEGNAPGKTFTVQRGRNHDILHLRGLGWDGIRGYSVIEVGRNSIGAALAAERNAGRFWASGGRPPYHLEHSSKFKDDASFEKFRADWERTYSVPWRAPILEQGITYKTDGLSMRDAQALESRLYTVSEIGRWFDVYPHMIGDLSRATFSNIEHLALEFYTRTLAKWVTRIEQEFRRCVLTPEEKANGYFLKHNLNALLRGDFASRMAGYSSALQNGHMNIDEVRDLEDRNKLANGIGSHYHIQTNMGTIVRDGQIQPAQPLTRLDEPSEAAE